MANPYLNAYSSVASEAARKQVSQFNNALAGFTNSVKETGLSNIKSSNSLKDKKEPSELLSNLNRRRVQAGLDTTTIIQSLFPGAPLLQGLAGGVVDIGKSVGKKLFKSKEEKEEEENKKNLKRIAKSTELTAERLKRNTAEEEEQRREDRDFWAKLFGKKSAADVKPATKTGMSLLGLGALTALAFLDEITEFFNNEENWNNITSGLTQGLSRIFSSFGKTADDIIARLTTFTDDLAKSMDNISSKLAAKIDEMFPKPRLADPNAPKAGQSRSANKGADKGMGVEPTPSQSKLQRFQTDEFGKAGQFATEADLRSQYGDEIVDAIINAKESGLSVKDMNAQIRQDPTDFIKKFGTESDSIFSRSFAGMSKFARKALTPLGVVLDGLFAAKDIETASGLENVSKEQLNQYKIERSSGAAGSVIGGFLGAGLVTLIGGAVVTAMAAVLGAIPALIIGAILAVGTWIGSSLLGESLFTNVAEYFTGGSGLQEKVNEEGTGFFDWMGEKLGFSGGYDKDSAAADMINASQLDSPQTDFMQLVQNFVTNQAPPTGGGGASPTVVLPGTEDTSQDTTLLDMYLRGQALGIGF